MDTGTLESFREKLDKEYEWPSLYKFKFIVPENKADDVRALFQNHEISERPSSKGNYISITSSVMVQSSQKVIEFYVEAHKIEGVIAL